MKKRLILLIAFISLLLCSCGKQEDDLSNYTGNPEGYAFVIFTDQIADISLCSTDLGTEKSDKLLAHYKSIEEKYSCTIEPRSKFTKTILEEIVAGSAASINNVDVVETSAQTIYSLYKGGYLTALNDIPNVDVSSEKWGLESQKNYMTFSDKLYGFCGLYLSASFPTVSNVMFYNRQIIDDFNLADPYEYIETGEWNWASFETLARGVTSTLSDLQSTYAFVTPNSTYPDFINAAVYSNGGKFVYEASSGKKVCNYDNTDVIDALTWTNSLVNSVKVSYDMNMDLDNGKLDVLAFINRHTAFLVDNAYTGVALAEDYPLSVLGSDLRWISFPRGKAVQDDYNTSSFGLLDRFCAVTATNPRNVRDMAPILNDIMDPIDDESSDEWREKLKHEYFMNDKDFNRYMKMLSGAGSDGRVFVSSASPSIDEVLSGVISGIKNSKQGVSEIEDVVNGLLSE